MTASRWPRAARILPISPYILLSPLQSLRQEYAGLQYADSRSRHQLAAIHLDYLAVDVAAHQVGRDEQRGADAVFGRACPPLRMVDVDALHLIVVLIALLDGRSNRAG